jgi:hypothetical protein
VYIKYKINNHPLQLDFICGKYTSANERRRDPAHDGRNHLNELVGYGMVQLQMVSFKVEFAVSTLLLVYYTTSYCTIYTCSLSLSSLPVATY